MVSCSDLNLHISRVLSCSARIIPQVTYLVVPKMWTTRTTDRPNLTNCANKTSSPLDVSALISLGRKFRKEIISIYPPSQQRFALPLKGGNAFVIQLQQLLQLFFLTFFRYMIV